VTDPVDEPIEATAGERKAPGNAVAQRFIEEVLGPHSSHPATAPRRLAFWRWVAVSVGGLGVTFAGIAVYRAFAWQTTPLGGVLSGLRQAIRSADVILFMLAVAMSATLAAALTIRVSRLGPETSQRPFSRLVFNSSIVLLGLLALGTCALFGWLATTNSIPVVVRNRWWIAVAAALPLEAILVYVEIRERRQAGSVIGWVFAALRQVWFAASVTATAMVLTPAFSRMVGNGIGSWLKDPPGILGGVLQLVPGSGLLMGVGAKIVEKSLGGFISSTLGLGMAMVTVAWITTKVARVAAADSPSTVVQERPTGFFGRLLGFLNPFRWFRGKEEPESADQNEPPAPGSPKWFGSLAASLKDAAKGPVEVSFIPAVDASRMRQLPNFAPDAADSELELLFGGRSPTDDQVAALRMFDERWFRLCRSLQASGFGPAHEAHADMLLQAFPESFADPDDDGVLEFQVAAAMMAVVARGQRVLFLVSDEEERARALSAVQSRFESMRIETLYRVGSIAPSEMSRWAPPAAAPGTLMEERPPDVMIGTLGDYEAAFFGGANAAHVTRAILFDAEVVMVPNLLSLTRSREGRLHFAFILDKHRLILASENRLMQLVAGTPPIGERPVAGRDTSAHDGAEPEVQVALESIALRLFGGDAKLEGHSMVLRRRAKSLPARVVVRIPAAAADACLDAVALKVAGAEGAARVCVLLGREDARPSEARLSALAVGKERVAIIHELDFPDVPAMMERIREFPYVVVQGRAGGRLVRELASRLGHDAAVIVEVTSGPATKAIQVPKWSLTLPVFPSADSPALALAHLRSAAFQLGADAMMRRDEFVRFGIGWNHTNWTAGSGFQVLHEGWSIELDGRMSGGMDVAQDQGEIWPAAIVRSDVRKERPVSLAVPVERGLALSGEEELVLSQDGDLPDARRLATWIGPRGQILGTVDLAYVNRLVWAGERQEYRAVSAERSEEHGWVIKAQPYHGEQDEPELPAVELRVEVPASAVGSALQVRQGDTVRVFSVRDRGGAERCLSSERVSGLVARNTRASGLHGAVDASTVTPLGPLEYSLRVGLSFVCIGSGAWLSTLEPPTGDHRGGAPLPAWIRGGWEIGTDPVPGREFSPSFTAALQSCLHSIAPGILEFSRVAAFRLTGSEDGVVIAFIEPHATVGTAAESMRILLDDPSLRRRFVGRLIEAVASDDSDEAPAAPLFLVRMGEEDSRRDREWTRRLITAIPGSVIDVGAPIGAIALDREAPLDKRPEFVPSAVAQSGALHAWKWRSGTEEVTLAVEIGVTQQEADAATLSYGCDPDEGDADRLRRCGIRTYEGNRIGPDYAWMVRRSEDFLKPLAERLLAVAQQAGASTVRERVEVFASFVQSFRYQLSAEGRIRDGKLRLGVQMPAETLFAKCGDCDSLSILLLGLVRAADVANGCVVLIDEIDGGHAMAAFEIEPRSKADWAVRAQLRDVAGGLRTFTLIETTASGWRLGRVATEYFGRYVRLDAFGRATAPSPAVS